MTDHEMIINKVYIKKKSKTVIGFISEESLKIGTVVKIVYKEETKYFEILFQHITNIKIIKRVLYIYIFDFAF